MQYCYNFGALFGDSGDTTFTLGAINPLVEAPAGARFHRLDATVHDPRGRLFYLNLTQNSRL